MLKKILKKSAFLVIGGIFTLSVPAFANEQVYDYNNEIEDTFININVDFIDGQEIIIFDEGLKFVIRDELTEEPLSRTAREFSRTVRIYDTTTATDIWVGSIRKTASGTSGGGLINHNQLSIHQYNSTTASGNPITPNLRVTDFYLRGNGSDIVNFRTNFSFRQDNGIIRNRTISMGLFPNGTSNVMIAWMFNYYTLTFFISAISIISIVIFIKVNKKFYIKLKFIYMYFIHCVAIYLENILHKITKS